MTSKLQTIAHRTGLANPRTDQILTMVLFLAQGLVLLRVALLGLLLGLFGLAGGDGGAGAFLGLVIGAASITVLVLTVKRTARRRRRDRYQSPVALLGLGVQLVLWLGLPLVLSLD